MGREGAESASEPVVVEKGLEGPSMIWLHVQPATQRLLLVPDLGVATFTHLFHRLNGR